jgi:sugar fermentation stimulation protein A
MATTSTPIHGPLFGARFLQRCNRFLIQVRLEDTGEVIDAHLADPGRLKELLLPEKRIWLRPASNPERRTRWTATLVEGPGGQELVSLDTTLPNRLVGEALLKNSIEELAEWELVRGEVTMGRSRLDFLLSHPGGQQMALEVKSVTLVEEGIGLFPDAVTERGARHLRELAEIAERPGWKAGVLFVLQRSDASKIMAARSIDPKFAEALAEAKVAGVRVLGRRCKVFTDRVELGNPVPVLAS